MPACRDRSRSLQIAQAFKFLDDLFFGIGLLEVRKLLFEDVLDEFLERAVAGVFSDARGALA